MPDNLLHSQTERTALPGVGADRVGRIALGAAIVSFIALVVLIIGHLVDPTHFSNTKSASSADELAVGAFVLGLVLAILLGIPAWLIGRRAARTGRAPAALALAAAGVLVVVGGVIVATGG